MIFGLADKSEKEEILAMYRAAIGTEGCTWTTDYPSEEHLEGDYSRKELFVLKNDSKKILGAISIDDDEQVDSLECWNSQLQPAAEFARLVVKEEYQNQGIARKLLEFGMEELKRRGYKSVHFLVSKTNYRAIRSYARYSFDVKGEVYLYGENWLCYEKEL